MKELGNAPGNLGIVDLSPVENMAWLYCPIKLPGQWQTTEPANLRQFEPLMEQVFYDVYDSYRWRDSYVYITAKTLWVTPDSPGNRPGWHTDGFGSDDLNYIWADRNPTLFWVPPTLQRFSDEHIQSMREMTEMAEAHQHYIRTYPDKTLLRLDETVIHNVAPCTTPGFRSFVKVSVSSHRYLLAGNSVNHKLAPDWKYEPRGIERNDPIAPLMKAGDGHYDQSKALVG